MDGNFEDAVTSIPQSRNKLENRRDENDKVPRGMWKAVETSTREVGVGKAKGGRSNGRSWEEERGKG